MTPRVFVRAWLLCACACWLPRAAHAGPLQDVEDAASEPSDDEPRSSASAARDDDDDDDDDIEIGGEHRAPILKHIVLFPWTLPRLLIDDTCLSSYAAHPYRDGPGLLRAPEGRPECAQSEVRSAHARRFALHSDFEASYLLQGLWAGTFAARLALPARIELEGRIRYMRERVAQHEQALAGTAHISYRFAQSSSLVLRTGVGLRAFSLNGPLLGIDVLYGMDLYARKPLIVHLELHAGSLGVAFAGQARAAIGVQLGKVELYAGYDHTVVMGEKKAKLGGPIAGVRAWF